MARNNLECALYLEASGLLDDEESITPRKDGESSSGQHQQPTDDDSSELNPHGNADVDDDVPRSGKDKRLLKKGRSPKQAHDQEHEQDRDLEQNSGEELEQERNEKAKGKFPVDATESSSPGQSGRVNADGVNADGVNADGVNADGVNADGVNADGVKADGVNTDGVNAGGMKDDGMNGDRMGGGGINKNGANGDEENGEHTVLNSSSNLENFSNKHLIVGRQEYVAGTSSGETDVRLVENGGEPALRNNKQQGHMDLNTSNCSTEGNLRRGTVEEGDTDRERGFGEEVDAIKNNKLHRVKRKRKRCTKDKSTQTDDVDLSEFDFFPSVDNIGKEVKPETSKLPGAEIFDSEICDVVDTSSRI